MLSRRLDPFRFLHERTAIVPLPRVALRPGISGVVQVTICHAGNDKIDRVATFMQGAGSSCTLTLIYDRPSKPLQYDFKPPLDRLKQLQAALRAAQFDVLDDDLDLAAVGVDSWLVERASGSFTHDVILSPTGARGHHREVIKAVQTHLPEVLRDITL